MDGSGRADAPTGRDIRNGVTPSVWLATVCETEVDELIEFARSRVGANPTVVEPADLVQDLLLHVLEGRCDNHTIQEGKVVPFLRAVLANRIRHHWRGQRWIFRRSASLDHAPGPRPPELPEDASWAEALRLESRRRLGRALWTVSRTLRRPLVWYYMQGRDVQEIADLEGVSPTTIWKRLSRGRRVLFIHYSR